MVLKYERMRELLGGLGARSPIKEIVKSGALKCYFQRFQAFFSNCPNYFSGTIVVGEVVSRFVRL